MTNARMFSDRMKASLSRTRQEKLQAAKKEIDQADQIIERVVTVLESDKGERKAAAKTLRGLVDALQKAARDIEEATRDAQEVAAFTEQQGQLVDVATGEFKESAEILKKAAELVQFAQYDLAHTETFLGAYREYLTGHKATVKLALELMDTPLVKEIAAELDPVRRAALLEALRDDQET